jgi:hypothetical protein
MQPQQQQQQQHLVLAVGSSSNGLDVHLATAEFEMVLDEVTYAPRFVVYLREDNMPPHVAPDGTSGRDILAGKSTTAGAAAVAQATSAAGSSEAGALGAKQAAGSAAAGQEDAAAAASGIIDTAVSSLVEVLPVR